MNYDEARALIASGTPCTVCGKPATDAHHINHKGMGGRGAKADGDPDDATPLCRECHTDHHDRGTLPVWRDEHGVVWYMPRGKTAKRIHKRDGSCYPAREGIDHDTVDERPEPADPTNDTIAVIEGELRDLEETEGRVYRYKAVRLAEARDLFRERYGAEGLARFREWRAESLGMGKSPASKLLAIADALGEEAGRDLNQAQQYALARAVKAGAPVTDCIAEFAGGMPVDDFLVSHGLKRDRVSGTAEVEHIDCPLGLSCPHPKEV